MKPDGEIKLVSGLLDLPLMDRSGQFCGIVDDLEFSGGPGKELKLKALLVGPGAYAGRLPGWAMRLVRWTASDRVTRVPIARVRNVRAVVELDCAASELGLAKSENAAARWLPRKGAL
jgi:hypothetical protein